MNVSDYVVVNVMKEFPALWEEYLSEYNMLNPAYFTNFMRSKEIDAFAIHGHPAGEATIRHDHLMWLRLKYQ